MVVMSCVNKRRKMDSGSECSCVWCSVTKFQEKLNECQRTSYITSFLVITTFTKLRRLVEVDRFQCLICHQIRICMPSGLVASCITAGLLQVFISRMKLLRINKVTMSKLWLEAGWDKSHYSNHEIHICFVEIKSIPASIGLLQTYHYLWVLIFTALQTMSIITWIKMI